MLDFVNPNLLAFIAAFFIAAARACYRGGLSSLSPAATTLISLSVTLIVAWVYYQIEEGVADWPIVGLFWFSTVGVLGTYGARYLSFISINHVGLARTSIVVQTSLVFSAVMAVIFLGEQVNLMVGLGTLGIMIGSILLIYRQEGTQKEVPLKFYVFALLTALCLATAHLFTKFGFLRIPSASLGMAVSSTSALFAILATLPFTAEGFPRVWVRRPLAIVTIGGFFNALAGVFFLSAVKGGRIVEVIPINRLSVLLIIFFSWLFFRKQEAITFRVVLGGLLSVAGAFAIVWGRAS